MRTPSPIIRRKAQATSATPSPRSYRDAREQDKPRRRRSLNEAAHKLYR